MTLSDRVREAVAQAISRAFPKEPVLPEVDLVPPGSAAIDPFVTSEIIRAFGGRRWDELTVQDLSEHADWWIHLTPCAFRYYIPAYLCHALDFDEGGYEVFFVVRLMAEEAVAALPSGWRLLLDSLTSEQLGVICDWHKYLMLLYPEDVGRAVGGSVVGKCVTPKRDDAQ